MAWVSESDAQGIPTDGRHREDFFKATYVKSVTAEGFTVPPAHRPAVAVTQGPTNF